MGGKVNITNNKKHNTFIISEYLNGFVSPIRLKQYGKSYIVADQIGILYLVNNDVITPI